MRLVAAAAAATAALAATTKPNADTDADARRVCGRTAAGIRLPRPADLARLTPRRLLSLLHLWSGLLRLADLRLGAAAHLDVGTREDGCRVDTRRRDDKW